ncbi:MAG TPA: MFS transporter [Methylomirabilota bacterium]|jgi:MFS family permease|nr:MFS transporter [Methylomirabilota bacterium]
MRPAPFYGWVVLGAAFAIITLSIGTLFTLGVFLKPIEEGMGWSRSSIGAVGLLNWLVMGLGGVAAGYLSDRFGTRVVVLVGGALLGLGLVLSSQVSEAWQLYVTFGVLVGAGVSAFYVPLTVLAIRWFDDRRGMAAAVVSAGNGLGIMALSPLSRWLINELDWRSAFVVLGDLAWLIVIPCALLLTPSPTATPASGWATGRASVTAPVGQILVSWPIWAIALTHFACCAAHSGPIFHLVSHAMDQGVGSMAAASILGVSGLSSIVGRVGSGIVADRLGVKRTLIVMLAAQAVLIPLYLAATSEGSLWGLSLVFGVAYGGVMPLYAVITREYFGEAIMGTAYGWVFFISCIGMGLGSFAGGAIHDALGSYQGLFVGSFAVGAMAVLLAATLRPPALPRLQTAEVRAA